MEDKLENLIGDTIRELSTYQEGLQASLAVLKEKPLDELTEGEEEEMNGLEENIASVENAINALEEVE